MNPPSDQGHSVLIFFKALALIRPVKTDRKVEGRERGRYAAKGHVLDSNPGWPLPAIWHVVEFNQRPLPLLLLSSFQFPQIFLEHTVHHVEILYDKFSANN